MQPNHIHTSRRESRSGKGEVGLEHHAAWPAALLDHRLLSYALPCRHVHRNILSLLVFLGVCASFWPPLLELVAIALGNEHFSHVVAIPVLTFYLLFLNRRAILTSQAWSPTLGILVMASGAACYWHADGQDWTHDRLAAAILAFVVMCWGQFLFSFGVECFRKDLFPLMMLLFMVPLPPVLLDTIIVFLQRSSADTVDVLFSILGIRALRDGFTFELTNFIIFIEEECSGIRSFFALIITSLLAGNWLLRSWWARAALVAVVVPLAIIKNAFRIVGLSLLANAIDPAFLMDSALHRYGGIPLFALSCTMLVCIAWLLYKLERRFKSASYDASRARA